MTVFFAPCVVGHAGAIARERDHIGNSGLGRQRNIFAKSIFDGSVIFQAIQALGNLTAAGVAHGADQSIAPRNFILIGFQQIDTL